MKRLSRIQRIAVVILIIIAACITCYFATQPTRNEVTENLNFSKATSEEVFHRYLLDYGAPISPEVEQIQGIEGTMFGYMGPAYIRFQATDKFVNEIIEKGYVEPFIEIPCSDFLETSSKYFVKGYPEKFD